jgi:hypothetical protein
VIRLSRRAAGRCVALVCCTALALPACAPSAPAHAQPSPEELARCVLDALSARDVQRLQELTLTEQEFRDIVWPELPASRPERNLTAEYVWNDMRTKSAAGLQRALAVHGGQRQSLVEIAFTGGASRGRHHLIHRKSLVTVQREDGTRDAVRLFGSVWEYGGGYKVFSWVAD